MLRLSRTLSHLTPRTTLMRKSFAPLASFTSESKSQSRILYTKTDEAPMLATYSLLPMIRRFATPLGIEVGLADISVAARILAQFPDRLKPDQVVPDTLTELGALCKTPEANIIKLPNVSASLPQLTAAIKELQAKGYNIPDYPANASTSEEKDFKARYAKVLGSAVNPVLREGNSDRRVAGPVKEFAQKNPKKMGAWKSSCKTHVAHMTGGDFFSSEQSTVMAKDTTVRIEHVDKDGNVTVLKAETELLKDEVLDASRMSVKELKAYFEREMTKAKEDGVMLSLHLKATMMKVSDPIMFGHAVKTYFKNVVANHGPLLDSLGVNFNNGFGDLVSKLQNATPEQQAAVQADIDAAYAARPGLAMVDSRKGITNLHVPSDVIIDASMPNVVRDSGGMWNKDDALEDVICLIPDRSYATMYEVVLNDCRENGQFDPATMGNVSNVGLMAKKAEEYGSHDKTFEIAKDGEVRVVDAANGEQIFTFPVETGDIWRACQTKDVPIKDWVRLAVSRARATGDRTVFWLDANRAHDRNLIAKVNEYLKDHDLNGLDIDIMTPQEAVKEACTRARAGKNTISVTGNVLRDYLTDLFPILELGTSAKMLSIVPLLAGGGMYETGAGGSAPKHVQQFVEEGHLRWDSLGEYLAVAVSLEDLGNRTNNPAATLLGQTLTAATAKLLNENLSPSRKVNELDNRGSSYYIAKFWAEALAEKDATFADIAEKLSSNEKKIVQDLLDCQGQPQDIGGYYLLDDTKANQAMRPSSLLNSIIDA